MTPRPLAIALTLALATLGVPSRALLVPAHSAQQPSPTTCPTFASQVGRIGDATADVAVAGGVAYVAIGPRIRAIGLDVGEVEGRSEPADLQTLGEALLPAEIAVLDVDEGRGILVAGTVAGALHVFGISQGVLAPLAAATIGEEVLHLQVQDGRIYAMAKTRFVHSLVVFDLVGGQESQPLRFVEVGRMERPPVDGDRFFLRGDDLYGEGRRPPALQPEIVVVDVRDPTAMAVVGGVSFEGGLTDMAFAGNVAYVATSLRGVGVIDLSDPWQPAFIASMETPRRGLRRLVISGTWVYGVAESFLYITDVTDPAAPVALSSWDVQALVRGLALDGDRPVLAGDGVLRILSGDDATALAVLGRQLHYARTERPTGSGNALALVDDRLYAGSVGGAVHAFDLSDPVRPREGRAAYVQGDSFALAPGRPGLLFATEGFFIWPGRLITLDLLGAGAPSLVGVAGVPGGPGAPAVLGDHVFVWDVHSDVPIEDPTSTTSLTVYDVSDPAQVRAVHRIEPPGDILAFVGTVGYHQLGREIRPVDLSEPTAPVFGEPIAIGGYATSGLALGTRLLLATAEGLEVLDVSVPMAPRRGPVVEAAGRLLVADGHCVYLTHDRGEGSGQRPSIHVLDASASDRLEVVADLNLEGASPWTFVSGLAIADGFLYATAPELFVLALGRAVPTATPLPSPRPLPTPGPTAVGKARLALPWAGQGE